MLNKGNWDISKRSLFWGFACFLFWFIFRSAGDQTQGLCMLPKLSTTELHPQTHDSPLEFVKE
jgi:hypothetical protein